MTTTFYRTRKGHKAHAKSYCANARRAIGSGDILPITDLKDWAGCQHCCTAEQLAELAAAQAPAAKVDMCSNPGVVNPKMIYGVCKGCGKQGKTNRQTGALRAHKPQA